MLESENVEMVRRRGRWATTKVMEAYLQEILYITFAEGLDRKVRTKILQLAEIFPAILERPFLFWMLQLPQPPGGDSSKPATRRSMERIVGNDGGSLLAFGTNHVLLAMESLTLQ